MIRTRRKMIAGIKNISVGISILLLAGCATPRGGDHRSAIKGMRDNALKALYAVNPDLEGDIERSAGYAVFSSASLRLLYFGGGSGYGIAVDQETGSEIYMKMAEVGVGLGVGAKDYRTVFVFKERETFNEFTHKGWVLGGQASMAVKSDDKGTGVGGEVPANFGMDVYQLTEAGLVADVMMVGTKFWVDSELTTQDDGKGE